MSINIRPAVPEDRVRIRPLQQEIADLHHEGRPDLFKTEARFFEDEEFLKRLNDPGHTVLIANDTAFWKSEASWKSVENAGIEAAILDSTCSYSAPDLDAAHMSARGVVEFRDELLRRNALAPNARVVANHFSHNGGSLQDKLENFFLPNGIEVGFDGMVIELA